MEIPSSVEAEPQSLPSPVPFASCFPIFVTIMGRFLGCLVQGHELMILADPFQLVYSITITCGEIIPD